MTRKAWMPITLMGWVTLLGQTLALCSMVAAGLFYVTTGVVGLKGLRGEVTEIGLEVDDIGSKLDRLIHSDSTQAAEFSVFRTQTNCILDKVVKEEPIQRFDCVPAGGSESQ